MANSIKLETLDLEIPVPESLIFHDEGYLNAYEFYNKICNFRNGRDLRMLEIANLGFDFGSEYGALESYIKEENGQSKKHIHIYCESAIKDNYPLNQFVKGHEETHVLQPPLVNGYEFLKQKMQKIGINPLDLTKLTEEQIAHIGGLTILTSQGVSINDISSQKWQTLIKQAPELIASTNFQTALCWFLKNKN